MKIIFSPIGVATDDDWLTTLSVSGEVLTINGSDHDLAALESDPDTGLIIDGGYIQSATKDASGEWTVTLLLPLGDNASEAQRFPEPVTVESGTVPLPEPPEEEAEETTTAEAE